MEFVREAALTTRAVSFIDLKRHMRLGKADSGSWPERTMLATECRGFFQIHLRNFKGQARSGLPSAPKINRLASITALRSTPVSKPRPFSR
jgi:hypothetical protein